MPKGAWPSFARAPRRVGKPTSVSRPGRSNRPGQIDPNEPIVVPVPEEEPEEQTELVPPQPLGYPDATWVPEAGQWYVQRGDSWTPIGGSAYTGTRPGDVGHHPGGMPTRASEDRLYTTADAMGPRNWSQGRIVRLQEQLADMGLLETYRDGYWDDASMSAYAHVLGYANQRGIDAQAAMSQFGEEMEDAVEREVPQPVVQLTPSADLRTLFRNNAVELTGQGLSQDQVDSMIVAYHNLEREQQVSQHEAQYDMSGEDQYGPGGEIEAAPSPDAFLQSRIEEEDPLAIPEHELIGNMQDVMSLLASPAWGNTGFGQGGRL